VTEPRQHRRYTKREKLAAVMATEMAGVVVASEQTGIPATTIEYWLHKPEFAAFRTRTREELADEVKVAAHLAWKRVAETLPTMEPRDAIFAAEKASTILQLLSGEATARTETRALTDSLDDHERAALADAIDGWLKERA
jgi:transposase-like protein